MKLQDNWIAALLFIVVAELGSLVYLQVNPQDQSCPLVSQGQALCDTDSDCKEKFPELGAI
jgi:hypothetical protein